MIYGIWLCELHWFGKQIDVKGKKDIYFLVFYGILFY